METIPSMVDISTVHVSAVRRNIFFLETSCNSTLMGKITTDARQACAVESGARANPNSDVYLLYASPGHIKEDGSESDRLLQVLKSYQNVHIFHINVLNLIKDSPVEKLWKTGKIEQSLYPLVHTSDIFRLLVLWKYGGIYMDLDVVVMKSLEMFPENFIGAQSPDILANGVMSFDKNGKGHEFVDKCLKDLAENFDGQKWSHNGPLLVTRILKQLCQNASIHFTILAGQCDDISIVPPSVFYPVPWQKWDWYLDPDITDILLPYIKKESYLVHVWNKYSRSRIINKEEINVPYFELAKEYCPGVVSQIDNYF
ncbi:hypothetical protein GWI33_011425 [Rhynchophorus ferrugineus]|uniref:Alpha 1,4-glycosyltransferase domain-containing protein n=1 Tax=Rhynchophorus ferrugineus TaxID=354439 RepID=A0A834MJA0_RHYFE|nr:hypothetical protein GWI33_011425 [Rhynchophorus ferrugineus]